MKSKKICENCEQTIGNLEESFYHKNHVVCKACKTLLGDEAQAILTTNISTNNDSILSSSVSVTPSSNNSSITPTIGPYGVGGWLFFFCIGLTILGPLVSFGQMSADWEQSKSAFNSYPSLKTAVLWENFAISTLLVYGFIVGCIIWTGSTRGRQIAQKYLLIRFLGFIAIEIIALMIIVGALPSEAVTAITGGFVGVGFRELVYFLIWWFYFKKSKRVRNTYEIEGWKSIEKEGYAKTISCR